MIENENDLNCSKKHGQPIVQIIMNSQIPVAERLLCATCLEEYEGKSILYNFKKAKGIITQKQEKIQDILNELTKKTSFQLEQFKSQVETLKSNVIKQFDQLIQESEMWANSLAELHKTQSSYSLLVEIEKLDDSIQFKVDKLNSYFNQFNYSYIKKMENSFQVDNLFKDILSMKQSIDNLNKQRSPISSYPIIEIKKSDETDTPYIPINCSKHNNKIMYIDLRRNIKREERLLCINCSTESAVNVNQFVKDWEKYCNSYLNKIQDFQFSQQQKIDTVKGFLYNFIVDLTKIIKETIDVMQNNIKMNQFKYAQYSLSDQMINIAEKLSDYQQDQKSEQFDVIQFEKINQDGFDKLQSCFQYFYKTFSTFRFESFRQPSYYSQSMKTQTEASNHLSYKILDSIKNKENCFAISFNNFGSIMATAGEQDITIWKFRNGKIQKILATLKGHTRQVYCLVYSKSRNWIASGSQDQTIRLWKDIGNNGWGSSDPGKKHKGFILCLIMNSTEDQLISAGGDNFIIIWKINYEKNELIYEYSLDNHQDYVYQIYLNESENSLVSCSAEKQIHIWGKQKNEKWKIKDTIKSSVNDYGKRICFINDQMIAWLQYSQGYTHIFKMENGQFIEKKELKIELKQTGTDENCLFPSVFNKQKQILIQKHNKYVYIIRLQQNGEPKIECDPIDCFSLCNYGGLSNDGQYLVIWNDSTKEFRVHKLLFE